MTLTTAEAHVIDGTTLRRDGDFSYAKTPGKLAELKQLVARRKGREPKRVIWMDQAHGAQVVAIEGQDGEVERSDALITNQPDVLLTVRTADCVPVFLESPRAIGIVHVGMAGALKQVFPRAVRAMKREYHVQPGELLVRFGPHICEACYEMSPRNLELLEKNPDAAPFIKRRGDRKFFTLVDFLISQAGEVGVGRVEIDPRCTYHDQDFFSARRGHQSHRQVSYVMLGRHDLEDDA